MSQFEGPVMSTTYCLAGQSLAILSSTLAGNAEGAPGPGTGDHPPDRHRHHPRQTGKATECQKVHLFT